MNNSLAVNDHQLPATTDIQARVDMMLANRQHIIEKVKPLLIEGVDIYRLPGMKKDSLGKPGSEKLAAIFGYSGEFELDKDTMAAIGATANGKQYVAYICNLYRHGERVGQGRGATFIEWDRTQYRNVNAKEFEAIKATLQPSDYQAQKGQYGTYYRVKDGKVFDPLALNKSIKMAQKSAFVDAVIRATGMSDLFTQDLEDMRDEIQSEPPQAQPEATGSDEPFAGTPNYQKPATDAPKAAEPAPEGAMMCDLCGSPMKLRHGPKGDFYGCGSYPNCKNIKNL